jgi:outer membrane protein OmpA-like peptidoglycan-associated protein
VEANTLLSQLRAQIVSDELAAHGVDAGRITRAATGAPVFMVQPLESRRVVIEVGKQ